MTQKQSIGVIVGIVAIVLVFVFVYRQFATPVPGKELSPTQKQSGVTDVPQKEENAVEEKITEPETIDDIVKSINDEASLDLSVDDEVDGEISEVEADSNSVINLGTSYDENSL